MARVIQSAGLSRSGVRSFTRMTRLGVARLVSRRFFHGPPQHVSCCGSMTSLSFSDITGRLASWKFPDRIDAVVGIATGGVVPAALVAMRLGVEMKVMALNYRDDANEPRYVEPRLLVAVPDSGRRGVCCWSMMSTLPGRAGMRASVAPGNVEGCRRVTGRSTCAIESKWSSMA